MQNIYYVGQLNTTTPQGQAPANQIDDELRQIKSTIVNTFPQFDRAVEFSTQTLNQFNTNITVTPELTAVVTPLRCMGKALDLPTSVLNRSENDLRYVNLPEFSLKKYVPASQSESTDLLDVMFKSWTGTGRIDIENSAANVLKKFVSDVFFPVGSVVFTVGVQPTYPGDWVKISGGRYIVTEGQYYDTKTLEYTTYSNLQIGGSRTVVIGADNLPAHQHGLPLGFGSNDTPGEGSGTQITIDSDNNVHQYTGDRMSQVNVQQNTPLVTEPQYVVLTAWRRAS